MTVTVPMRNLPWLTLALVALAAEASPVAMPAPGALIAIGDYQLHLHCLGSGTPTVVMDAGMGGTSLDWARVQPAVAADTRVCAYDRAGYGWSDGGPLPRTSDTIAQELRALLERAGVMSPYVLVGHSFGGYNVRLFASYYPQVTAGLILVDSAHEDQFERFEGADIEQTLAPKGSFMLRTQPRIPENLPQGLKGLAQAMASTYKSHRALRGELLSFRLSADQVREAAPLPDVPLVVISRGQRVWSDDARGERMERLWMELQDDLVRQKVHARLLVADEAGHYVHLDEPQIVIDAIRSVVGSLRQ